MSSFKVSFFGATDIGRVRTNNEDTFIAQYIWDERHILLAAIDGMGGEEGGEIAADIARVSILKYLSDFQNDTILNLIKRALADANNEIIRHKEVQPQYSRMGCVATAGIIDLDAETLSIAHVGDSRLYRFSKGELSKLTHDHSLVGYQEEQGILTEEQAMRHPRRSVIERCLGSEYHMADDMSFIEAGVFPLMKGEKFLFCSDGLSDVLTSAQISDCLRTESSPEGDCLNLISRANEAGGKDNITVVVAQVSESECADHIDEEEGVFKAEGSPVQTDGENQLLKNTVHKREKKWKLVIAAFLAVFIVTWFMLGIDYLKSDPLPQKDNKPALRRNAEISGITEDSVASAFGKDTFQNMGSDNHE